VIVSEKRRNLETRLAELGECAVAYSGGVDSSLLLAVARRVLGERVAAITVETPYTAAWEATQAAELAALIEVPLYVIRSDVPETVATNPPLRCLYCKRHLFGLIWKKARGLGFTVLADGSNADDPGEHRPGLTALRELEVRSPLMEAGLTKAEVRAVSRELGLPSWNRPAFSCLLTRLPHDTPVRESDLRRIERSELALMEMGFQTIRVRHHGEVARVEVAPDDIPRIVEPATRRRVVDALREAGYRYVALDLAGYRTGSMAAPTTEEA
jgi:pyridinium-3,5-biscarboxylic acid mononucleotide sulfurtransferase